ncbi:MAG: Rne/Rng family ribonuclease [Candidatus Obscuribacterales bacterium]|nr:Rne/Rng family ribonuclease [Candidatus Obscuribacterales bacterium]
MRKSLVISEQDNIAALLENDRVCEFFVNRGELLLGDIYTCTVENILPGIDAAFVNLGKDKMGFLHANDVPGQGPLKERLVPKQKLLVQITKEPTGHKGPRVSTAISLPGRFLVLVPEERGVSISRRISESRERARLKAVVNLMKPPGVGLIIRTEAKGQGEDELFEDFQQLWDTWQTVVSEAEASIGPLLIYRDQDLLYRVIRDAYSHEVTDIIVDSPDGQKRAQEYLSGWASKNTRVSFHTAEEPLLLAKGIDREIESALTDRAELPSGGHLNIQPTEALTVIDVNSGRFTSSRTQAETVRRTNLEAAQEIPRQLRLRNIGGMVIVDFIDMESRKDQQQVLEQFQRALEDDRAKPQIGQLSDLGLVELTRRRQGQSLRELFTLECTHCTGQGVITMVEVGPAESRKAAGMKAQEDDVPGKKYGRARSSSVLKSASAAGGRIVSTVANGDDTLDVPEEILAQMPEELLDPRDRSRGRIRPEEQDYSDEEDEGESSSSDNEPVAEAHNQTLAPKAALFVEDEDEDASTELTRNISAVEEVYQEISVAGMQGGSWLDREDLSDAVDDSEDAEDAEEVDESEVAEEETPWVSPEISPSPYEAVEGPVSGVFTLNKKPESAATACGDDEASHEGHAHHEGCSHGHQEQDHDHSSHHESISHSSDCSTSSDSYTGSTQDSAEIRPNFQILSREIEAESRQDDQATESGNYASDTTGSSDFDQLKIAAFSTSSSDSDSQSSEDDQD